MSKRKARQIEIAVWCALALAAGVVLGARPLRAVDFRVYYTEAQHYFHGLGPMFGPESGMAWSGGVNRYPPIFLYLFRPLSWLPLGWALGIWAAGKVLACGAIFAALRCRWRVPYWAFLPGALLVLPYALQELRYGNIQFYIVALVIAAFLAAGGTPSGKDRDYRAGLWLGFAAALKVWPLFFYPCLLAQRRFRFLAAASASALGFTCLPAVWLGARGLWAQLLQWEAQERSINALSAGAGELWYPGQSLHDVMRRYLGVVDYSAMPDPNYRQVAWAHWAPAAIEHLWLGIVALLLVALFYGLYRLRDRDTATALMFCAVMLIEPHVHRLILETLLWPALLGSVWLSRKNTATWQRALLWCAVAASVLEPLIPGSARQRLFQVYGVDLFLVVLPLSIALAAGAAAALRPAPSHSRAAKA